MKPKEYIEKLEKYADETSGEMKTFFDGKLQGATEMWTLMRAKQNEYRDKHREELRAYNTQYQRERRARLKKMKEGIDKIAKIK